MPFFSENRSQAYSLSWEVPDADHEKDYSEEYFINADLKVTFHHLIMSYNNRSSAIWQQHVNGTFGQFGQFYPLLPEVSSLYSMKFKHFKHMYKVESLAGDQDILVKITSINDADMPIVTSGFQSISLPFESKVQNIPFPTKTFQISIKTKNSKNDAKFLHDIQSLQSNEGLSDFTLIVVGKKFQAHKAILGARCSFFNRMFTLSAEFKEKKENQMTIGDIPNENNQAVDVFQEFLNFIYTGDSYRLSDFVIELLFLADKYDVTDLKASCETQLRSGLDLTNAADIFQYAHLYNCKYALKQSAFALIQQSFTLMGKTMSNEFVNHPERVKNATDKKKALEEALETVTSEPAPPSKKKRYVKKVAKKLSTLNKKNFK